VKIQLYALLFLMLGGGDRSVSRPDRFGTLWPEDRFAPRAGLDANSYISFVQFIA